MTRFEISGEVTFVIPNKYFFVMSKTGDEIKVPDRQDLDTPNTGDKVTIAVEVYS